MTHRAVVVGQLAAWGSWADEHGLHDLVRLAVARVIEAGGAWRASSVGGSLRVYVEAAAPSCAVALRLGGFTSDGPGRWTRHG